LNVSVVFCVNNFRLNIFEQNFNKCVIIFVTGQRTTNHTRALVRLQHLQDTERQAGFRRTLRVGRLPEAEQQRRSRRYGGWGAWDQGHYFRERKIAHLLAHSHETR